MTSAAPLRGRRRVRPSGDDRLRAILATAERLLAERGLDEISVDDLARGAGISRPTFYFYFASKEAVLLTLLDRVIAEVNARVEALPLDFSDPVAFWRHVITDFVEVFAAHRGVTVEAARTRSRNPEVSDLWAQTQEGWVAQATIVIEAEQMRGAALPAISPRNVAIALNLLNERVLPATFSGDQPSIPEAEVADVLLGIWLSSIYGTVSPVPAPAQ